VVAALTVGIRRSGILVALLSLPLYVPVLVFGAGSLAAASRGQDPVGALLMLGAGIGCGVDIEAEGPDAADAIEALSDLVARKFDEDQ